MIEKHLSLFVSSKSRLTPEFYIESEFWNPTLFFDVSLTNNCASLFSLRLCQKTSMRSNLTALSIKKIYK